MMIHNYFLMISLFLFSNLANCSNAQVKPLAFPGAEGFGKYTTGGRGGKVMVVTTLNDSGPGSLREAIGKKEPRIIVFSVSGNIELESSLDINYGNVTIAGQSSPGGICVKNYPTQIKSDNVILRFLRFRLGDAKAQQADALGANKGSENIIIDHCSISWATDECGSFYRNKNFTLQWCILSESLNQSVHEKGNHGYGGIWGGMGASFHHNLMANHTSRLPRFSGSKTTPNSPDELVDFRNNVIYNWVSNNTYGGESGRYNVVANYYKSGPATKTKVSAQLLDPWAPFGQFYVRGNYFAGNTDVTAKNSLGVNHADSVIVIDEFLAEVIPTQTATEAFDVVLKYSGASLSRDAVDTRIVEEVRNGKSFSGKSKNGIIDSQNDVGGWPVLESKSADVDTDQDGMPDVYEKKAGLNFRDGSDAVTKAENSHYTNIEIYLNYLVEGVTKSKPE